MGTKSHSIHVSKSRHIRYSGKRNRHFFVKSSGVHIIVKFSFFQKVGPICLSDDLHVSPQNVEQYLQRLKHV